MKLCLALMLPALAACGNITHAFGLERTSEWYTTPPVHKPSPEIARVVRELVTRQGYDTPGFDPDASRIETAWDTHLSPRYREGYRTMIEAEILPAEGGAHTVRVRSSMEVNNNDTQGNIAERAEWVGAGISEKHKPMIPGPAIHLYTSLKLRLFGLNQ